MADRREDAAQEMLFREVDEDLRHEQMTRLWKKYGGVAVAAALAIVLGVAGYQGWQAWQASVREDAAAEYQAAVRAVEAGNTETALERLAAVAAEGDTGYASVAALRRAALLAGQGDTDGAVAAYRAVAADAGTDRAFRDLATILSALHRMTDGAAAPDALIAELQPLTAEDSAFRFTARELTAALSLRQGDEDRARDLYAALSEDPGTPQGLRNRAQQMLAALGGAPAPAATGTEG